MVAWPVVAVLAACVAIIGGAVLAVNTAYCLWCRHLVVGTAIVGSYPPRSLFDSPWLSCGQAGKNKGCRRAVLDKSLHGYKNFLMRQSTLGLMHSNSFCFQLPKSSSHFSSQSTCIKHLNRLLSSDQILLRRHKA